MPALRIGMLVILRDFQAVSKRWRPGKVAKQLSDQSYAIISNDTQNIVGRDRVDQW